MASITYTDPPPLLTASQGFVHGLFGLACWELLITARYELDLVRGRRAWKWHSGFFILGRVALFTLLFLCAVGSGALHVSTTRRCQEYISAVQVTQALTVSCATLLLVLRVFALWNSHKLIVIPLSVLNVAQLGVGLTSLTIMKWGNDTCWYVRESSSTPYFAAAQHFYALGLDTVILVLAFIKLWPLRRPGPRKDGSNGTDAPTPLSTVLLRDGLLYYALAFVLSALSVALALGELNPTITMSYQAKYSRELVQNFTAGGAALRTVAAVRLYLALAARGEDGGGAVRVTPSPRRAWLTDPVSIFEGMGAVGATPAISDVAAPRPSETLHAYELKGPADGKTRGADRHADPYAAHSACFADADGEMNYFARDIGRAV